MNRIKALTDNMYLKLQYHYLFYEQLNRNIIFLTTRIFVQVFIVCCFYDNFVEDQEKAEIWVEYTLMIV